jgi:uncharacterized membrane protein YfcA
VTIFLLCVGAVGGALNAVAGGGSFLALPALLWAGVTPVAANATCTLALWPGSVSSAIAYRRDFTAATKQWLLLGGVSVVGALAGALLLLKTSDTSFLRLLPWLMLLAAAMFTFGSPVSVKGRRRSAVIIALTQFVIAIYGGYFGGGIGIMMLAGMSIAGMTDIHEMNGLKTVLSATINGVALATFIVNRTVVWQPGGIMLVGGIAGGYFGAATARTVDRKWVRLFVVVVGWTMTLYFFLR